MTGGSPIANRSRLGAALNINAVRNAQAVMEIETTRFYESAAQRTTDVGTGKMWAT